MALAWSDILCFSSAQIFVIKLCFSVKYFVEAFKQTFQFQNDYKADYKNECDTKTIQEREQGRNVTFSPTATFSIHYNLAIQHWSHVICFPQKIKACGAKLVSKVFTAVKMLYLINVLLCFIVTLSQVFLQFSRATSTSTHWLIFIQF